MNLNHFVLFYQWREPAGYSDLLLILTEHGIFPQEHLPFFQDMTSFRNMLLHRYENMDDELVFDSFKKRLADFDLFMGQIMDWTARQKENI